MLVLELQRIDFFGCKFTVAQALSSQLAVDYVPPVVGTVQYMDHTLDYWYKDLEALLTGQITKEHINQPGFSYTSQLISLLELITGRILLVPASKSSSVMTMCNMRLSKRKRKD